MKQVSAQDELLELEFWQRVLAADIHPSRLDASLCLNGNWRMALDRLLNSPVLHNSEKDRAKNAPISPLAGLSAKGVKVASKDDLPEHYRLATAVPPALFCWGDATCLNSPCLAIVGTRGATTYGKAVAQKFAEAVARAGVTVISGGALGIDAAAHQGALAAAGKTVAVLLTGIEKVYPRVHHGLFDRIRSSGCLLSQFSAGSASTREYRPLLRNYTVAALSNAVLVVEAPERSGALSTASAANDLGRQVFVAPANIDNHNFRGSHALIRDGATLVDHPDQVLEAMSLVPSLMAEREPDLSDVQKKILSVLSTDPLRFEKIAERADLPIGEVLSELTMLELEGLVIKAVGGYAVRP